MNTELGNTTLESLGILTGIEGYRAALADPPNWQARLDGESQWLDYEDKLDNCWSVWDARMIVHDSVVQWRRKPDMKRDPMRYVVRPIELRDDMIVGEPNGHFVDVNLRLPFAWNRRVASIAVEEIVDKPASIPLQPAQPEAVTMTAAEATEWLKGDPKRRVLSVDNIVWRTETGGTLPERPYPYTPLIPATRSQVETEREIDDLKKQVSARDRRLETKRILGDRDEAEWKAFVEWSQNRYNDKTLEDKTFAICGDSHIAAARKTIEGLSALVDTERTTLASALGSQKAAVAALEVERAKSAKLRLALEDLLDVVHCEAARNAECVLSETAGKESG